MSVALLQREDLTAFQQSTFDQLRQLFQEERRATDFGWLTNDEAAALLDLSKRTLQFYRDAGLIGYSQLNGKIFYCRKDLDDALQRHYRKPFETLA